MTLTKPEVMRSLRCIACNKRMSEADLDATLCNECMAHVIAYNQDLEDATLTVSPPG